MLYKQPLFIVSVLKRERDLPRLHTGTDTLSQSSHNRQQAPSVSPPTSGGHVFTTRDNREEEMRREGGERQLRSLINDTIVMEDEKERCGTDAGRFKGGVGAREEIHGEVTPVFIRPQQRCGSASVSQGSKVLFQDVAMMTGSSRTALIFSHTVHFSRRKGRGFFVVFFFCQNTFKKKSTQAEFYLHSNSSGPSTRRALQTPVRDKSSPTLPRVVE